MDRQKPFPAIFLYLLMAQSSSSPHDRSHGVWGVVLHPRIGMDPKVDYLSPAFFAGLRASVIHGRFAQNVTFSEPLTNPLSIQPIIIQVPSSLLPLRYRSAMMKIALYHSLLFINHPVS